MEHSAMAIVLEAVLVSVPLKDWVVVEVGDEEVVVVGVGVDCRQIAKPIIFLSKYIYLFVIIIGSVTYKMVIRTNTKI